MTDQLKRNDPCPCGSGKKYKKCCLPVAAPVENQNQDKKENVGFSFEPGSYGNEGGFIPSIACVQEPLMKYQFVIVHPEKQYAEKDQAAEQAELDLDEAFKIKESAGTEESLALALKEKGYVNLENFKIIPSPYGP